MTGEFQTSNRFHAMMQDNPQQQRQVLLRCLVANDQDNSPSRDSIRYVEQSHFRLWQYLLANKHHLTVQEATACLWMPQKEYDGNTELFIHAGKVEPVLRLGFAIYDVESGLCEIVQRFLPAADAPEIKTLLLQKIPLNVRQSDNFTVSEEPGYAVLRKTLDLSTHGRHLID